MIEPLNAETISAKIEARLYDAECEMAVLGTILLDNATLALVEHQLRPGDFHSPRYALVYETMLVLRAKQRPIDVVTMSEALRSRDRLNTIGGAQQLGELAAFAIDEHDQSQAGIQQQLADDGCCITLQDLVGALAGGRIRGRKRGAAEVQARREQTELVRVAVVQRPRRHARPRRDPAHRDGPIAQLAELVAGHGQDLCPLSAGVVRRRAAFARRRLRSARPGCHARPACHDVPVDTITWLLA